MRARATTGIPVRRTSAASTAASTRHYRTTTRAAWPMSLACASAAHASRVQAATRKKRSANLRPSTRGGAARGNGLRRTRSIVARAWRLRASGFQAARQLATFARTRTVLAGVRLVAALSVTDMRALLISVLICIGCGPEVVIDPRPPATSCDDGNPCTDDLLTRTECTHKPRENMTICGEHTAPCAAWMCVTGECFPDVIVPNGWTCSTLDGASGLCVDGDCARPSAIGN